MGKGLGTDGMMDLLGGIARQVGRGQEAEGLRSDRPKVPFFLSSWLGKPSLCVQLTSCLVQYF